MISSMYFERILGILAALVCACVLSTVASAQNERSDTDGQEDGTPANTADVADVSAEYESPRATVETFIAAGEDRRWMDAAACLDIPGTATDHAGVVAQKLFAVIDAVDPLGPPSGTPVKGDARIAQTDSYLYFPRTFARSRFSGNIRPNGSIVLVRMNDGRWLFSRETCEGIDDLFESMQSVIHTDALPISVWIERSLPDVLTDPANRILGLKYWQWIGLLVLVLAGVMLDYMLRGVLATISQAIIRRKGGEARRETLKRTVRPFGLFAAAMFWVFMLNLLGLPLAVLTFLVPAIKFFAMLAGLWASYRLTDLVSEVLADRAERSSTKIDDVLVPMVRKSVKIFLTAIGIIFIADSFDVEILPLLTGLGIGSLAFAFAAKDTIENFFGSVSVIADRPFEVGDWVKIGDVEGTVEELGFRSTRVRTFYNSLVTVPNATLVRATVDNFGKRKYRRWKTHLNITYDTKPDQIEAFCEGVRELIRLHPYTRKDYYQVWLHQFSAHSLDILLYVFHEAPDWQTELRERQRLMLDIMRLAEQLNVEFAFPTQTLHIYQEEREVVSADGEQEVPHGDPTGKWMREGRLHARKLTSEFAWRREKPGPYRISIDPDGASSETDEDTQIESKVGGDA